MTDYISGSMLKRMAAQKANQPEAADRELAEQIDHGMNGRLRQSEIDWIIGLCRQRFGGEGKAVAWRYKDSGGHFRYVGNKPRLEHAILKAEPLYLQPAAEPSAAKGDDGLQERLQKWAKWITENTPPTHRDWACESCGPCEWPIKGFVCTPCEAKAIAAETDNQKGSGHD